MKPARRLLYAVTEEGYFLSHRLPTLRAAQQVGFETAVVTEGADREGKLAAHGARLIPFSFSRRSLNPLRALVQIAGLARLYRRERPDIVHHIAMKPVLYGSIAAWCAGVPVVVNAFAGLGFVFCGQSALARALRLVIVPMFRVLLRRPGSYVMVQNGDDLATLNGLGLLPEDRSRVLLVRGSGVDLDHFTPQPFPDDSAEFICVFPARMLAIKGLATLREAFELLRHHAPAVRLWLCGRPDPANPASWTLAEIEAWTAGNPAVIYKGHCDDMKAVWAQAHAAVLPSTGGEGVPKALLEAAACGRAIVATDVPGCRDVVSEGENGFLVPPGDAVLLAERLLLLAGDRALCRRLGAQGRALVAQEMSAAAVTEKLAGFYKNL